MLKLEKNASRDKNLTSYQRVGTYFLHSGQRFFLSAFLLLSSSYSLVFFHSNFLNYVDKFQYSKFTFLGGY